MNPLPIHLHRQTYWAVPLLIFLVGVLIFWALSAGGGSGDGTPGNPRR